MRRQRLLPFIVAAAVAMIAIINFTIMRLIADASGSTLQVFHATWPLLLTSTIAVILVMSALNQALERILSELEEEQLAARNACFLDPLTGLGNRQLMHERLQQAAADLRRNGRSFAVLMLDLDRFKDVNDVYGHAAGDELLVEAASRLASVVRETDTLIRFGGDEFMVLQRDVEDVGDIDRLSERISSAFSEPFVIQSQQLSVGTSAGAAVASEACDDPTEYVRRADIALYEAKRRGRNRIELYSSDLGEKLQRRSNVKREVAEAIRREALTVFYQPQVSRSGDVVAVEALLRWESERHGSVPTAEVVAIAEECGLIKPLGELVFRSACQSARIWPQLTVAVNFSPSQLQSPELPDVLVHICREEGVACERMELEITESLFLDHEQGCEELLENLRRRSFKIAIDDFGAGYSSLRYLRRFHVDKVKLDRGFSEGAQTHQNIALIRAAVMLAHALDLTVVAEGIETREEEQVALQGGCDGLQGFLFAPPMPLDEMNRFLKSRRLRVA